MFSSLSTETLSGSWTAMLLHTYQPHAEALLRLDGARGNRSWYVTARRGTGAGDGLFPEPVIRIAYGYRIGSKWAAFECEAGDESAAQVIAATKIEFVRERAARKSGRAA